jgi:hypothetical protein
LKNLKHIHAAFGEWRELAAAGQMLASDETSAQMERWFGPITAPGDVKKVFDAMVSKGEATPAVAKMICVKKDFDKQCEANPNQRAYTIPETGKFHICPTGLKSDLLGGKCGSIKSYASSEMRGLTMTLLHEMTQVPQVGQSQTPS